MVKASDKTGEGASKTKADFSPVDDAAKSATPTELHSLFGHPVASMAAAAAIGVGFASQIAGAFFGTLQGMVDVGQKLVRESGKDRADANEAADAEAPLASAEVTAAPVQAVPKLKIVEKDVAVAAPVARAAAKAKQAPKAKAAPMIAKTVAEAPAAKGAKAPVAKTVKTPAAKAPAVKAAVAGKPAKTPVAKKPVVAKTVAEKPAAPVKAEKPAIKPRRAKTDDLKKIAGIGPKLEQMLNGMGVSRYADIAGWSGADIARIDGELDIDGRIGRDDWVGQAKALIGGKR